MQLIDELPVWAQKLAFVVLITMATVIFTVGLLEYAEFRNRDIYECKRKIGEQKFREYVWQCTAADDENSQLLCEDRVLNTWCQ